MLDKRKVDFYEMVHAIAAEVGKSAPKIADKIMTRAFPMTTREAAIEGADKMLRVGVIAEIKNILKSQPAPDEQRDFSEIDDMFKPFVEVLGSNVYFVESLDEFVSVPQLIAKPALLNEARQYMRRKGNECLAEADKLDQLYTAVIER